MQMRKACSACSEQEGRLETRNGQDCVFCVGCGAFQYNAPKTETGRVPRTVTTVHNGITARQRARILVRSLGRCDLCGAKGDLHVGHLLSVKEGLRLGLTEVELNNDENLAAFCPECNLGLGQEVVPLRLMVSILMARLRPTRKELP
jgi:5-methylcytosine-specific restriction endonuclease McrA